jgi:hypothetical protein
MNKPYRKYVNSARDHTPTTVVAQTSLGIQEKPSKEAV